MAAHREGGVTRVPMAKVGNILEKVKSESALEEWFLGQFKIIPVDVSSSLSVSFQHAGYSWFCAYFWFWFCDID